MEEEKSCHPIPPLHNANSEVTRSLREIPPAHFIFKIESFSQLSQLLSDAEVQNYESDIFEASGYKWKLSFYPNGDKKRKGEGHISLYLYMTMQDANGKVRRFHRMKTEWGFAQLLPLSTFNDADNGYLICDTCVFGAEVFWNLRLYPKGDLTAKDKCLSLFLGLDDLKTFPFERKTYAKYKMRIRNQYHGEHMEIEVLFQPTCMQNHASKQRVKENGVRRPPLEVKVYAGHI
ncbi:unnamed protein product [Camellia sinensis]